jgi:plastocyanin
MTAAPAVFEPWIPRPESHREWPELSVHAPQLVATMRRYLLQLTTFLAPRSVGGADDERLTAESAGPVKTLPIELGDLFVKPDRVEVPAGTHLVVEVTNNGDLVHTLNLKGDTSTGRLQPGESQTADFGVIDADTQAWCTVPGHKEAGMVLTIAVTPAAPGPT